MTKKDYLKIFIRLDNVLEKHPHYSINDLLNEDLDAYDTLINELDMYGYNKKESNKIIGSFLLTINGYDDMLDFKNITDPNIIIIASPKTRYANFTQKFRGSEWGSFTINNSYSVLEAKYKIRHGEYDDMDFTDEERESYDLDIDEIIEE